MANMITVTFNPETASQAAVIAQAMAQYLGADVATPDTSEAVAHEQAKETAAKKPRAAKAAASTAAAAPSAEQPSAAPATESSEAPGSANAAAAGEPATLEDVRAKLTALSQGGKAPEVKALIAKFGGVKLTDIPADKYAQVLAAAEGI